MGIFTSIVCLILGLIVGLIVGVFVNDKALEIKEEEQRPIGFVYN